MADDEIQPVLAEDTYGVLAEAAESSGSTGTDATADELDIVAALAAHASPDGLFMPDSQITINGTIWLADGDPELLEWILHVQPDATATTVAWSHGVLPADPLGIREVQVPEGTPQQDFTVDMSAATDFSVTPGSTRFFLVSRLLTYDLDLGGEWNFFSVPLDPFEPAPEVLLDSSNVQQNPPRSGIRAGRQALYDEEVWEWGVGGEGYRPADAIRAATGYWAYTPNAATVTVVGFPVLFDSTDLAAGWNAVGPLEEMDPPQNDIVLPTWGLSNGVYDAVSRWFTGNAYWVYATRDTTIPLKP